jgi:hypothetical protein
MMVVNFEGLLRRARKKRMRFETQAHNEEDFEG